MQISVSSQVVAIRGSVFLKYLVVLTPLMELYTVFPFHVNCIAFMDLFLHFLFFFFSFTDTFVYFCFKFKYYIFLRCTSTLASLNKELYPDPDGIITEN